MRTNYILIAIALILAQPAAASVLYNSWPAYTRADGSLVKPKYAFPSENGKACEGQDSISERYDVIAAIEASSALGNDALTPDRYRYFLYLEDKKSHVDFVDREYQSFVVMNTRFNAIEAVNSIYNSSTYEERVRNALVALDWERNLQLSVHMRNRVLEIPGIFPPIGSTSADHQIMHIIYCASIGKG